MHGRSPARMRAEHHRPLPPSTDLRDGPGGEQVGQPVCNAPCDRCLAVFIVLALSVGIGASASGRPVRGKGALPDGPGKKLATQYCQDCHSLANLTSAHKQPEQWRKTVQTMIDRGARLPPDKIDVLVDYLAKNFPPAQAGTSSSAVSGASSVPSGSRRTGLPEGSGKAIATQYCQSCHSMMLVTRARKSAPQWRQTIQKMVYFGSTLPKQDVEPLTRYLAKNFGPAK